MKMSFLSLLGVLFFSNSSLAAVQEVGNGGVGKVCLDQHGDSVFAFDYWEYLQKKNLYVSNLKLRPIANGTNFWNILDEIFADYDNLDLETANAFRTYLDNFLQEAEFVPGPLPFSGDLGVESDQSETCFDIQIGYQYAYAQSGIKYIFDRQWWDMLDQGGSSEINKAMLVMHEFIIREFGEQPGLWTTQEVRQYVQYLFSMEFYAKFHAP